MKVKRELPRECWLCGRNGNGDPLDKHHIFGGGNRKKSEQYGLYVLLCHSRCHENGPEAVHRNPATARRLHEYGQRRAMEEQGWTAEDFRLEFGRNYIDGEDFGEAPPAADEASRNQERLMDDYTMLLTPEQLEIEDRLLREMAAHYVPVLENDRKCRDLERVRAVRRAKNAARSGGAAFREEAGS